MAGRKPTGSMERFAEKCKPVASGCVEWTGGTTGGYGAFSVGPRRGGRMHLAHRWLFEQTYGKQPASIDVCHKCDNPKCVNIAHLFAGTRKQNMEDAVRKGRTSHVARTKGETHPMAKLTRAKVNEIRERLDRGESQSDLAFRFDVTVNAIHCIVRFKTWRTA